MIYTVTFNPALDYTMEVNSLNLGQVNRTKAEHITAGGKGINVSTVLNNLGVKSTALGFIGGFTGAYIEDSLTAQGIESDFVHLTNGLTRINVKLLSTSENDTPLSPQTAPVNVCETTDINAKGPEISSQALDEFYKKLDKLNSDDILILSGAIPPMLPSNTYSEIMKRLESKALRIIVDAAGDLLVNTLPLKPFLIKPNIDELQAIFNTKCNSTSEVVELAKKLQEMGARNVLVSLGEKGALFVSEYNVTLTCNAPKGTPQSTVGAGDSMVAGFVCALVNNYQSKKVLNLPLLKASEKRAMEKMGLIMEQLRLAVAAGSATVFSQDLANKETIMSLYETIETDLVTSSTEN